MAENSNIEWTKHTWNPWHGCLKVSPGCKFCYMYREKIMYGQDPSKVVRSKTKFHEPLKWKDPAPVFTCSWSDFFIEQADEWRAEAWEIIRRTPHLTYQILTKRPENIIDRLPADWGEGYPNCWMGVSVENPEYRWRIDVLRSVPARLRFLSLEPLLGYLGGPDFTGIDWVIVGGESGPKARPMHIDWARSLRDQCNAFEIPFFFKQWGEWMPVRELEFDAEADGETAVFLNDGDRALPDCCSGEYDPEIFEFAPWRFKRVGKKAAGRELDGREWNEFPRIGAQA